MMGLYVFGAGSTVILISFYVFKRWTVVYANKKFNL